MLRTQAIGYLEREKMNAAVFGSENDGIVTTPCDRHDEGRNEDSGPSDQVLQTLLGKTMCIEHLSAVSLCVCTCVLYGRTCHC